MIDRDGDENYEPFVIPLDGGFPEPLAADVIRRPPLAPPRGRPDGRDRVLRIRVARGGAEIAYPRRARERRRWRRSAQSPYGAFVAAWSPDHSRVVLADGYTVGDVDPLRARRDGGRRVLLGTPLEERVEGGELPADGLALDPLPP